MISLEIRKFDLNIDKILEDWERYHAIREIIANALDEQIITGTREISIYNEKADIWHIRDYGRGISYEHFTQNENKEKINTPGMIGKFGIGLKDAMATFDRNNVSIFIKSAHGDIQLERAHKHSFNDVITLHACVSPPSDSNIIGTDIRLIGVSEEDILKAKSLFLKFSGEEVLETTAIGDTLKKKAKNSNIYINGVKVAEEENFLFSYNITSLDSKIKKAINRERTNVGRAAYTDRVKAMLISSRNASVTSVLADNFKLHANGMASDELKWVDVQEHAIKLLNSASSRVVFMTPDQIMNAADMVDEAKQDGYEIITIPSSVSDRLVGSTDFAGNSICEFQQFVQESQNNFKFKFVSPELLSKEELAIYEKTETILDLFGGRPRNVKLIKISVTMSTNPYSAIECKGLWLSNEGTIVIKRTQLMNLESYAGTLIHEAVHAKYGFGDVSRDFELALTDEIGKVFTKLLTSTENKSFFGRLFGK